MHIRLLFFNVPDSQKIEKMSGTRDDEMSVWKHKSCPFFFLSEIRLFLELNLCNCIPSRYGGVEWRACPCGPDIVRVGFLHLYLVFR